MSDRQTGRTTQQIADAPRGAVFVWCNSAIEYPRALAKKLGRDDVVVRPMSWLAPQNTDGHTFAAVVIDHAAILDALALDAIGYLRAHGSLAAG